MYGSVEVLARLRHVHIKKRLSRDMNASSDWC